MKKYVSINDIYQIVLRNYYNAMQEINIESTKDNEDIIEYISTQFNEIIELLRKCQSGIIRIESIQLLSDVSFKDYLKDKYIIEAVSSDHTAIDDNNIFIMKTPNFYNDDCSFFRIKEKDGHYIAIRYDEGIKTERDISITELNSFVSLNKALNDSKYICYSASQWIHSVTILYSGQIYLSKNYFTLYIKNNVLKLYVADVDYEDNTCFQHVDHNSRRFYTRIKSSSGERCINNDDAIADKAFILKVIEEQLDKQDKPEEGKSTEKPAVLSLKEKQNNNC